MADKIEGRQTADNLECNDTSPAVVTKTHFHFFTKLGNFLIIILTKINYLYFISNLSYLKFLFSWEIFLKLVAVFKLFTIGYTVYRLHSLNPSTRSKPFLSSALITMFFCDFVGLSHVNTECGSVSLLDIYKA